MPEPDYWLGHCAREWDRLCAQHALWREALVGDLRSRGLVRGARVLEVGCGGGDLLEDLAHEAGPEGRTAGLERDPRSVARARERLGARADVRDGDLMDADLGGPWDLVVARWVFSFLPDPALAIRRMMDSLAPGGRLVVQDYDHDGFHLFPDRPAVIRAIEGFRTAYRMKGGDVWVGPKLVGLMERAGLSVEPVGAHVMAGRPGEPAWDWVGRWFEEHVDTIVADGMLAPEEAAALRTAWAEAAADPASVIVTPIVLTVSGRR